MKHFIAFISTVSSIINPHPMKKSVAFIEPQVIEQKAQINKARQVTQLPTRKAPSSMSKDELTTYVNTVYEPVVQNSQSSN